MFSDDEKRQIMMAWATNQGGEIADCCYAIATKAAELLAARGGTDRGAMILSGLRHGKATLSAHFAAQGARVAVLEQLTHEQADRIRKHDRHISDLETSLENARKERDEALAMWNEAVAAREKAERDNQDSLNHLAAARQEALVWRQRVEKSADALSDVLQGEVGRLDLLARIAEVKRQRDEALADNAATHRRYEEANASAGKMRAYLTEIDTVLQVPTAPVSTETGRRVAALLERVKRLEDALAPIAAQARAVFEVHHAPPHCALGLNLKVEDGERAIAALEGH